MTTCTCTTRAQGPGSCSVFTRAEAVRAQFPVLPCATAQPGRHTWLLLHAHTRCRARVSMLCRWPQLSVPVARGTVLLGFTPHVVMNSLLKLCCHTHAPTHSRWASPWPSRPCHVCLTWALHGPYMGPRETVCVCVWGGSYGMVHTRCTPPPVFIIALGGHPTHSTLEVTIDQPLPLACLHYVRSMPASASLLLQRPALCSPSGWPRRVPLCAPCTCTGRAG